MVYKAFVVRGALRRRSEPHRARKTLDDRSSLRTPWNALLYLSSPARRRRGMDACKQQAKVARLVRKSQSQIAGLLQKQAKERLVRRPPAASPPRSSRTAEGQRKWRRLRGERRERDKGRQKDHLRAEAAKVVAAAGPGGVRPGARGVVAHRRSSCGANFMPWSTRDGSPRSAAARGQSRVGREVDESHRGLQPRSG